MAHGVKGMKPQVDEIISVRRKHLYWVQQGSRTLHATVDSTSAEAEDLVRARILKIDRAPRWGDIAFLAVKNEKAPENCALVALCKNCIRD